MQVCRVHVSQFDLIHGPGSTGTLHINVGTTKIYQDASVRLSVQVAQVLGGFVLAYVAWVQTPILGSCIHVNRSIHGCQCPFNASMIMMCVKSHWNVQYPTYIRSNVDTHACLFCCLGRICNPSTMLTRRHASTFRPGGFRTDLPSIPTLYVLSRECSSRSCKLRHLYVGLLCSICVNLRLFS